MTISYKKFFEPAILTAGLVTFYTVPLDPNSTLLRGARVRFVNATASIASVTAYAVPLGVASGGPANSFVFNRAVPPFDYIDVDVPIMKAGDFLQALSGTAGAISMMAIAGALFAA